MIEITSPGFLIIDKEKLGSGYSEPRNQNLGNILKKLNIIEQWGSGYKKITQELKEYSNVAIKIDDSSTFTQVKFILQEEGINENVGVNAGVNEIYEFIQQNQPAKASEISKKYSHVTQRTIERWIKLLKDENKIEFRGSPKTGGYFVK